MKRSFTLLACLIITTSLSAQLSITEILTENRQNPVGLDTPVPRFTWIMSSSENNKSQSACQINVAHSESDLLKGENLIWDSNKVESDKSVFVEYGGSPLVSGERYFWRVKVWDEKGKESAWSENGMWQMAFLAPEKEFTAKWITTTQEENEMRPSPMFRKDFDIQNKSVSKATAYITAHGMYEGEINGKRIGDSYFTPGWTSYGKRLQYQVYDVTELLTQGKNAVGLTLGNGWYRGYLAWGDRNDHYGSDISLLFQLEVIYSDGTKQTIITDKSWKSSVGPVLFSELYDGETYDSRKEMKGWSQPGFNSKGWTDVKEEDFPKNNLLATYNEPVRKHEIFEPARIITTPKGETVLDFGQNLVGWVQLKVSGKNGDSVELYHAEVLDKDGNFYTDNLRAADQKATYILNGDTGQVLEPHFTFMGFRYVKVSKYPGEVDPGNFKAIALYSDMAPTGDFTCSNPLLNQLQQNIQWGQKGNFVDIPTDCPQRDERLGWTGDAQAFFRTAAYNMNVNNFFAKWLKDLSADQNDNGSIPFVIPNVLGPGAAGSAGWADAGTIIPWETYLLYGDKKILEDQYPSMKAWVEYIRSVSKDDLWNSGFHFGDWLFYRPDDDNSGRAAVTERYYITQCFYAYSTQLLINAAEVLGNTEDVAFYSELLERIKAAFLNEFMSPSGRLGPNTQTSYVLALQFDLLPEELRLQAAKRLADNIESYGFHLTTGFLGTPYLNNVLSRFGQVDVAFKLLMQETYPSWLYPVKMGATTIWERWDGIKPDSTFQTPGMNSYNHYAYGAIGDWMYRNVAGINMSEEGPGYKSIIIRPIPGGGLTQAEGNLKTYYGTIISGWKIEGETYSQNVSIPVNTTAIINIPADSIEKVRQGGKPIIQSNDMVVLGIEDGFVRIRTGSGNYRFTVKLD